MEWAPLPSDSLSQLARVKELLANNEIVEEKTDEKCLADILFKRNKESLVGQDSDDENFNTVEKMDVNDYVNEPPEKQGRYNSVAGSDTTNSRVRLEKMLSETLEKVGDLDDVVRKMSSVPDVDRSTAAAHAGEAITEMGVTKLVDYLCNNADCDKHSAELLLKDCLIPALVKLDKVSRNLLDDVLKIFEKYPDVIDEIIIPLLEHETTKILVLEVLESQVFSSSLPRLILTRWFSAIEMTEVNLNTAEEVINLAPAVMEEERAVEGVVVGLARQMDNQSLYYTKFVSKFIKKLPGTVGKNTHARLCDIVDRNKTFMKKSMEKELKERNKSLID